MYTILWPNGNTDVFTSEEEACRDYEPNLWAGLREYGKEVTLEEAREEWAPDGQTTWSNCAMFADMLAQFGNIAELARQSGMSRRTFEYKRDGENPVTRWDLWAMERALQLKRGDDPDTLRQKIESMKELGGDLEQALNKLADM